MTNQFFTCKQSAGKEACGAQFHRDDVEDFKDHLSAHNVVMTDDWWDKEIGYSGEGGAQYDKPTVVEASQFGDGSEQQRRENGRAWHSLKQAEAISKHDAPASAFGEKARVIAPELRVSTPKGVSLRAPATQASSVTRAASSAVGDVLRPGVEKQREQSTRSRKKGTAAMTTETAAVQEKPARTRKPKAPAEPVNRFANANVVDLTPSAATKVPHVYMTTGRGFNDVEAIKQILLLIQEDAPHTVIHNQGRSTWEGEQLVRQVAESIGLTYEMVLPKFLTARNRNQPLIAMNERMTPEQDAEFGYRRLQDDMAELCDELHIFGTSSGPQRGLEEAFNEADKAVRKWGSSFGDD